MTWLPSFVCQLLASFTSFGPLLRCAYKCIVNIMKVYIEKNNVQGAFIRFRKKILVYSRLLLRSDEFWWICKIDRSRCANDGSIVRAGIDISHIVSIFFLRYGFQALYHMLRQDALYNDLSNMPLFPCTLFAWKVVTTSACSISANSTRICYPSLHFWRSRSTRECQWTHRLVIRNNQHENLDAENRTNLWQYLRKFEFFVSVLK